MEALKAWGCYGFRLLPQGLRTDDAEGVGQQLWSLSELSLGSASPHRGGVTRVLAALRSRFPHKSCRLHSVSAIVVAILGNGIVVFVGVM